MITHTDRAPLMRLAASLPVGSSERRTLLATLKTAGVMDDTLARADLVSGALKKSKTADRGPVLAAMQAGIGKFLTDFDSWVTDNLTEYSVGNLEDLREAELAEDDAATLEVFDKRLKTYGKTAEQLLGLLGEIGTGADYTILSNRSDYKLREAVMAGAAKGIHGSVSKMDSGRRQVTDIGRGGISTPGSMGVDAEDLAQVMLGGGMMMPGMIFNMNMSDKTDVGGGVKVRGKFVERKKPWCPAGTSIYTIAGSVRGPDIKKSANYARTVAMNAAVDWKRSVHVELEYILTPADEGDMDTQAINMGAKLNLESLLGAELIDGVAVSKQLVLARYYIKKIKGQMNRMLKPGVAKATWQAVVAMVEDKQSPWKTGGGEDFAINVPKVIKFLEDSREGQRIMQENGLESMDKRVMQARWKDAVKSLKRQLAQLSDDELLASYHLTLDGMVDDVPAYIKKIKQDQDLYKTYLSDMRKTASEQKQANSEKTAMRTITASERSAMIRLAATLPVGSPERRALLAGCEKLPNKAMQDNCEAKKEEGKKEAGCEKLPNEAMVENCEKKKEEAAKKEAGCEKLPNEKMQQMCEDKKEEGKKEAGEVPDALKEHQFTSEDNPNPKGNDKDGDGKTNEPSPLKGKKADQHEESKEKYPWDECIKQQTEAYSAEAAPKICGKIRAESQGRSASPKAALIRLAAALPVGSDERKTLIRMAAGA
jgi:hypothetical protein